MRWQLRIRYELWVQAIRLAYGSIENWKWAKFSSPDQYREDMDDALGMYLAGGEL